MVWNNFSSYYVSISVRELLKDHPKNILLKLKNNTNTNLEYNNWKFYLSGLFAREFEV